MQFLRDRQEVSCKGMEEQRKDIVGAERAQKMGRSVEAGK